MIVLDVETTGIDEKKNSIIEIGAIDFFHPEDRFVMACKPWEGAELNLRDLKINGNTPETLQDPSRASLEEAAKRFYEWSNNIKSDVIIAAQNPDFDTRFLKYSFDLYGVPWIYGRRTVDQHAVVYSRLVEKGIEIPLKKRTSNLSGDKIMELVGLPKEPRPHKALNGALWETEALSRVIYGKNAVEEFEKYPIPTYLIKK